MNNKTSGACRAEWRWPRRCSRRAARPLGAELKSLTVCADPGNMPLSNQKGEGFENKIAQVIGAALGTGRAVLLAALDRARTDAHHA